MTDPFQDPRAKSRSLEAGAVVYGSAHTDLLGRRVRPRGRSPPQIRLRNIVASFGLGPDVVDRDRVGVVRGQVGGHAEPILDRAEDVVVAVVGVRGVSGLGQSR